MVIQESLQKEAQTTSIAFKQKSQKNYDESLVWLKSFRKST